LQPTHDDITYESIAEAFGETLALHAETKERMTQHYQALGKEVNDARLRMATIPTGIAPFSIDRAGTSVDK
jgi:molybdopterin-biosynthesis enzyme MoeA-like protein